MKVIEVQSNGQVFSVKVDDGDYDLLARHKWYILFSGKLQRPYAFTRFYTEQEKKNGKTLLMHHLIMGTSGAVDHVNGDSLDNRKENLRVATYQENGWNKGKSRAGRHGAPSSPYKGVTRFTGPNGRERFRVVIKLTKKGEVPVHYVRGTFDDEIEAAKFYNAEVVKHRGQYAWLNPIPGEQAQA